MINFSLRDGCAFNERLERAIVVAMGSAGFAGAILLLLILSVDLSMNTITGRRPRIQDRDPLKVKVLVNAIPKLQRGAAGDADQRDDLMNVMAVVVIAVLTVLLLFLVMLI